VNLIGEHTDYNGGLSLAFAIEEGVRVDAVARPGREVVARALDRGERDAFPLADPAPAEGWRAFVRGTVAELRAAGHGVPAAQLEISGSVAEGAGLASSAALGAALCLALLALAGEQPGDRIALAHLISRVENRWVGSRTGLLDQIASLCATPDHAVRIDFRSLDIAQVPLELGGWRFAVADSGERRTLAATGYNERRAECEHACELLDVEALRDARPEDVGGLPDPLGRRVRHVLGENDRVEETVTALGGGDLERVGRLLDDSHASLRDLYDASTGSVERTVERLREAGAAGARMMGGGFGGSVLALFEPQAELPAGVHAVSPGPGAGLAGVP
jgi:galactokinase